jgi:flagellar biosynthesis/type III secretory pathway protein FliH
MDRFDKLRKTPAAEGPADGPARVMKGGDWGAVAETAMRGFQMDALAMPGRPLPKPSAEQSRVHALEREARKAEEAHKQALQKAKGEGEAAANAALARGREEGLREGEKKAWERYQKSLEDLRGNASVALDVLSQEKAALFLEFEGQTLELVSAVIHRVFEGFAKSEAEAVLPLLRKAIAALGQAAAISLKVNPADFKTADENRDFWLPVDAGQKDVRVIADERIAKGGCFVESDSTSVGIQADELAARIDDELKRVFAAKAQALKGAEPLPAGDAADAGDSA